MATRTTLPSSSIPYLRCHHSSRSRTTGTSSKLWTGTGDGIDHSRLRASHGSGPGAGREAAVLFDFQTLTMNTSIDRAIRNDPTVATMFHSSKP